MGYSCTITSDKEITELEIQKIIDRLPNNYLGYISTIPSSKQNSNDTNEIVMVSNKQSWGWSLYSDVKIPVGNQLVISGSYSVSGVEMINFVRHFVNALKATGHDASYDVS